VRSPLFDPSGTVFAVYDLLEQLGVRWYMPRDDLGTVLPSMPDITVESQQRSREPVMQRRHLRIGWGNNKSVFLWSKRQKLGMSELGWMCHGTSPVTDRTKAKRPEYFARVDGRLQLQEVEKGPGQARLASPLRDAMIGYGQKFFARYPELRHFSAGPNDGYVTMDDSDRQAGWLREQHGPRGRMSDYVWTFINDAAGGMMKTNPDKIVMGLAYSGYRMPPPDLPRLHPNVGVTYCQTRAVELIDPAMRRTIFKDRDEWLRQLPSDEFYVWEYFLWHVEGGALSGIPVVFTRIMQEDLQALRGKSKGEYVEAWPLQSGQMWGLNHLMVCLQARLYWEPDLDLSGFLDDYHARFYGSAAAELREFFEYAEQVWTRPAPR